MMDREAGAAGATEIRTETTDSKTESASSPVLAYG